MYIFIDESGIFLPSDNINQWSSVGALVVPDESLLKVKQALFKLKKDEGIEKDEEFKRNRPDSNSKPFLLFLKRLKKYKCTLHVSSENGSENDLNATNKHREETINGIKNYCIKKDISTTEYNEIEKKIKQLSTQQYNQCIHQSYMVNNLISKVISLYAQISPQSLEKFIWAIDQKNNNETNYDKIYKMLHIGLIEVASKNTPFHILQIKKTNLSYFNNSYLINNKIEIEKSIKETKLLYKKDFKENEEYIQAIDLKKLLLDNYTLMNSEESFGLQIADLLVSSVNRCLKGNFSDNSAMAKLLGKLMVNSHRKNHKAILLTSTSGTSNIPDVTSRLINIMDEESINLYKFQKEIYSTPV